MQTNAPQAQKRGLTMYLDPQLIDQILLSPGGIITLAIAAGLVLAGLGVAFLDYREGKIK